MNLEFELKLQALLDGELPEREAAEVEARVKADPQAQALLDELRMTTTALRGNELERALPETREFFWSKIERTIAAWVIGEEKCVIMGHGRCNVIHIICFFCFNS